MKRIVVLGALIATVLAAPAALADGHDRDDRNHRDPPRTAQHDDRNHGGSSNRDDRRDYGHDRSHDYGRDYGRDQRDNRAHERGGADRAYGNNRNYGRYQPPRGYVAHQWRRGERLPVAYYQRPYVVGAYRDYGLRAPPFGYQWVRVNGDAVLAAITTGIVLNTIFHVFG